MHMDCFVYRMSKSHQGSNKQWHHLYIGPLHNLCKIHKVDASIWNTYWSGNKNTYHTLLSVPSKDTFERNVLLSWYKFRFSGGKRCFIFRWKVSIFLIVLMIILSLPIFVVVTWKCKLIHNMYIQQHCAWVVCIVAKWSISPKLILVAWSDWEYFYTHLEGMLIHCQVTPRPKCSSTHLYTWVEMGTVRVQYLVQGHENVSSLGLNSHHLTWGQTC